MISSTLLNEWAANWMSWLLPTALASLLVWSIVRVLWSALRQRCSAHLGYALFLLPLLPLALPSMRSIEFEVWPAANTLELPAASLDAAAPGTVLNRSDTTSEAAGPTPWIQNTAPDHSTTTAAALSPTAWVMLLWGAISGVLLIRFLLAQWRTHRLVAAADTFTTAEQQRLCAVVRHRAPWSGMEFQSSDFIPGPAAWGLLRRRILLPPRLLTRLDDEQLAWVLHHEYAHHRRFDLWISALQRLVLIAWFFHPVAWWSAARLDRMRERACDEAASARSRASGQSSAAALLAVAAQPSRTGLPPALQALNHNHEQMENRIRHLMSKNRTARSGLAPLALPLLLAAAALCTTSIRLVQAQEPVRPPLEEVVEVLEPVEEVIEVQEPVEEIIEEQEPIEIIEGAVAPLAASIRRAQEYMISQQLEDGHWPTGPGREEPTGEFNSIGVTALVLLSLEQGAAGLPEQRRLQAITRGLDYLAGSVDERHGLFGGQKGHHTMSSHAVATLAWLRLAPDARPNSWKAVAETAVTTILRARNPYLAWRYSPEPDGDQDTFVTGLMVRALAAATEAGFEPDKGAIQGPLQYLHQMTDPESGRTGFLETGSEDPRLRLKANDFPASHTEMCTAMALGSRAALGTDLTESMIALRGLALVSAKKPYWGSTGNSVDYYYWLFGTEAMNLIGGRFAEKWNSALIGALLPRQEKKGEHAGSWPGVDAWSDAGALLHSTAVVTLALQQVKD